MEVAAKPLEKKRKPSQALYEDPGPWARSIIQTRAHLPTVLLILLIRCLTGLWFLLGRAAWPGKVCSACSLVFDLELGGEPYGLKLSR